MTAFSVVLCAAAVYVLTAGARAVVGKMSGSEWPSSDKGRIWLTWLMGLVASVGDTALRGGVPWSWETLAQAVLAAILAGGGFTQLRKMLGLDTAAKGLV